jgi:alpha-amylase
MSVLLQGFFFDVKSASATDWWDHVAGQAQDLGKAGFTAIWLPPPYKRRIWWSFRRLRSIRRL